MINLKYVSFTFIAVIVTWVLHEFSHWYAGELLNNDMVMTLNTSYPKNRTYSEVWHATLISIAGPIVTLTQAIIFYFLLKGKATSLLFPFLLACLYMRFLAGVMNFINLNDEGRISKALGLGTFTIPVLMIGILLYLTYNISKTKGYSIRFIALSVLLIMLFSSMIILGDQAFGIVILS